MTSVGLFDVLILACGGGVVLGLVAWRTAIRQLRAAAAVWLMASCALSLLAWILRWIEAGHWPIFGTWESALSLAFAVLVVTAGGSARGRSPLVAALASAVTAAILVHARGYDTTAYALTISERSLAVDVHALVAWAAFGCLTLNAAQALAVLLAGEGSSFAGGLARSLQVGFFLHSTMLVSGSFYKFLLFGRAWTFDPIETLGLVTWLAYGTLLHMHLLGGWETRRLARWCLGVFVLLVVSYRAIVYFPAWSTYHIFDVNLRIHLT